MLLLRLQGIYAFAKESSTVESLHRNCVKPGLYFTEIGDGINRTVQFILTQAAFALTPNNCNLSGVSAFQATQLSPAFLFSSNGLATNATHFQIALKYKLDLTGVQKNICWLQHRNKITSLRLRSVFIQYGSHISGINRSKRQDRHSLSCTPD